MMLLFMLFAVFGKSLIIKGQTEVIFIRYAGMPHLLKLYKL